MKHISSLTVSDADTAIALGSGDLPVWATPSMLALMENAAMECAKSLLTDGQTTVGGHIESSHICPSAVGAKVYAQAELLEQNGRQLLFEVSAYQQKESGDVLLGQGKHLRFIVDREKFLSKLA